MNQINNIAFQKSCQGTCSVCGLLHDGEDLTKDEGVICFNCLRKKIFLNFCDRNNIKLSNTQRMKLSLIRKQVRPSEIFEILEVRITQ